MMKYGKLIDKDGRDVITENEAQNNNYSNSKIKGYTSYYINKKMGDLLLKSISGVQSVSITSANGYGMALLFSISYGAVVQFTGTNNTPNIIPIYGTPSCTTSINGNIVTLNNLHNWDHYIFLGSSIITNIE